MSGKGVSQRGAEFQLQPVPASKRKRSSANNEKPRILHQPSQQQIAQPLPPTVRPARLKRSQSLPGLKARPSLDLLSPAAHSISIPIYASSSSSSSRNFARQLSKPSIASASIATNSGIPITSPTVASQNTTVYTPPIQPPINSQTLRELDLHEILKNPQLRHDLVFDADLQFRPNFDGDRGKRKRQICNKYWRAIQREIQSRCSCTSFYGNVELPCVCASAKGAQFYARIPSLIAELRRICLSILPTKISSDAFQSAAAIYANELSAPRQEPHTAAPHITASLQEHTDAMVSIASDEHFILTQCLDPMLIMQQLAHDVLDIVSLVTTVGTILKQHCAPMRDHLIDEMINTVSQSGDSTQSLRQCFEILELMKLDVANHQLSTSRIYLVDNAAEFEARWFRDQLYRGKISMIRTLSWFSTSLERHANGQESRTEIINNAFDQGILDLIFEPPVAANNSGFPETFQFDAYRMLAFHGEVMDITIVSMLLLLFRQLACSNQVLATSSFANKINPSTSKLSFYASKQQETLKSEIWTLLREAENSNRISIQTPTSPSGVASRVLDNRLSSWRKVSGDVVLQIASKAIGVQVQAFKEVNGNNINECDYVPSAETIELLTRWLATNLQSKSSLFLLCQKRIRGALSKLTATTFSTLVSTPIASITATSTSTEVLNSKKRSLSNAAATSPTKRIKLQPIYPIPSKTNTDANGLEAFTAELQLLAERIRKVKIFHLKIYRSHYEIFAANPALILRSHDDEDGDEEEEEN